MVNKTNKTDLKLLKQNLIELQLSIRAMKRRLDTVNRDIIKAKKFLNENNASKNKANIKEYYNEILKLEKAVSKAPRLN